VVCGDEWGPAAAKIATGWFHAEPLFMPGSLVGRAEECTPHARSKASVPSLTIISAATAQCNAASAQDS